MTFGMHFVLKLYKENADLYWILSTYYLKTIFKINSLEI